MYSFRCLANCGVKAALTTPIVLALSCSEYCSNPHGQFQFRWILYQSGYPEALTNLSTMSQNGTGLNTKTHCFILIDITIKHLQ